MSGWIAAIAGYVVFAIAVKGIVTSAEDSTIDTDWWVPQGTEDLINETIARIQQEQKARVESKLITAVCQGAIAMVGTGVLLAAWGMGSHRKGTK